MCRRVGAYIGNTYGSGTGLIWLDDLQCTGSETSLINCTHRGWRVHNCAHTYDVSIVCGDGTLCTLVGLLFCMQLVNMKLNEDSCQHHVDMHVWHALLKCSSFVDSLSSQHAEYNLMERNFSDSTVQPRACYLLPPPRDPALLSVSCLRAPGKFSVTPF